MPFHPAEKGGTKIETDPGVIVDEVNHPLFRIKDARSGIACVTFCIDPFIPIVVGIGRILEFHAFQPGIFPGRLVKMAVNTNVSLH
jgi:hypothetical protein